MIKKISIFLLILSSLIGCKKKTIQLPLISVSGETEVYNHSQIWVFYHFDQDKVKAKINKNNTITTTHWIINIDKRLPMEEIVPVLEMISAKRAKKTVHSVEGMKNYLSYSNIKDKNISLFNIDSIHYLALDTIVSKSLKTSFTLENLLILQNDSFELNSNEYPYEKFSLDTFSLLKPSIIHILFTKDISYQTYLEKRMILQDMFKDSLQFDQTEYMLL